MDRYEVGFIATAAEHVGEDLARRFVEVLHGLPGVAPGERGVEEITGTTIAGRFVVLADQGMTDAARDGSRLAQEALTIAGLPEARLVELTVKLQDDGLA